MCWPLLSGRPRQWGWWSQAGCLTLTPWTWQWGRWWSRAQSWWSPLTASRSFVSRIEMEKLSREVKTRSVFIFDSGPFRYHCKFGSIVVSRWCGWPMSGCCAETRLSWTPERPGGFLTSLPTAKSSISSLPWRDQRAFTDQTPAALVSLTYKLCSTQDHNLKEMESCTFATTQNVVCKNN